MFTGGQEAPDPTGGRLHTGSEVVNELLETAPATCEGCGCPLRADLVVCTRCGYHRGLKQQISTKRGSDGPPPRPLPPSEKDRWLRDYSKRMARREYVKPVAMLVVGAGIVSLVLLAQHGPQRAVAYLLSFLVSVPIGVAVLWLCSLLWIGFNAPMTLNALRLAGIYAVIDVIMLMAAAGSASGNLPLCLAGVLLSGVVYIALLIEMLDLEPVDAVAVAVATFAAKVYLFLALLAVAASWMAGAITG
jgi:hypothetical protein